MTYTRDQVDAAMCVWEELLSRRSSDGDYPLNDYWDWYGSCQVRDDCIAIAVWVEAIWDGMGQRIWDNDIFDWEFVPRMLDQVKWDKTSEHMYNRDVPFSLPSVAEGKARYLLTYGWK